jgi:hypothetical protein
MRSKLAAAKPLRNQDSIKISAVYKLVVRREGEVRKERHEQLESALDAVERIGAELADGADARPVGGSVLRRIDPVQQVIGRVELRGPRRLRAGVDVRGDGSSEAYTGRVRRELIEQRDGESAYDALRRELS